MNLEEIYKLFKAYDVRGAYPIINGKIAFGVGYNLIKKVLEVDGLPLEVVVLHDCRLSSPELYKGFIQGVIAGGGNVKALGQGSTDMMYFASQLYNTCGAMITASHNPKDDNGLKLVKKVPQMIGIDTGLAAIRDGVINLFTNNMELVESGMQVSIDEYMDVEEEKKFAEVYSQKLSSYITEGKQMKIVVDAGNGMGGHIMEHFISKKIESVEFVELYWDRDGNFPNHPANPADSKNMVELQEKVLEEGADLGMAFDGDGDRAFIVDEKGGLVNPDMIFGLLAKKLYPQVDNKTTVAAFSSSSLVPDVMKSLDGDVVYTKQGHTYIKRAMLESQALIGSEISGHYYFKDFGYMDSGILVLLYLISLLQNESVPLSELLSEWRSYYHNSEEINMKIESDFEIILSNLKEAYQGAEYNEQDGLHMQLDSWRFGLRKSNTEPVMRLRVETMGEDLVDQKVEGLLKIIKSS